MHLYRYSIHWLYNIRHSRGGPLLYSQTTYSSLGPLLLRTTPVFERCSIHGGSYTYCSIVLYPLLHEEEAHRRQIIIGGRGVSVSVVGGRNAAGTVVTASWCC